MRLALRVDFDDGDHLCTLFNSTEREALAYYFDNTFTGGAEDEYARDVVEVGFIVDGRISHTCNRQLYQLSAVGSC